MMIGDVVATLYITLFLRYISPEASIILWIGFALNIIGCIMAFWLVESPAWLVSVNRKDEAIEKVENEDWEVDTDLNWEITSVKEQGESWESEDE